MAQISGISELLSSTHILLSSAQHAGFLSHPGRLLRFSQAGASPLRSRVRLSVWSPTKLLAALHLFRDVKKLLAVGNESSIYVWS